MAEKLNKNLVSPAVQLAQNVSDLEEQRAVQQAMGTPEVEDAMRSVGPRPTILNVNTGEWEEVTPAQGRLRGVPLGPPNPDIINRMWRNEGRVYGSPWWDEQLT